MSLTAGPATDVAADVLVVAMAKTDRGPVVAVGLGALLGAYSFQDFRGRSADPRKAAVRTFVLAYVGSDGRAALTRARALADGVTLTRDLVNTPPNVLTPKAFADRATREA